MISDRSDAMPHEAASTPDTSRSPAHASVMEGEVMELGTAVMEEESSSGSAPQEEQFEGDIAARPLRHQDYSVDSAAAFALRGSSSSQSSGVVAGELGSSIPGYDALMQYGESLKKPWAPKLPWDDGFWGMMFGQQDPVDTLLQQHLPERTLVPVLHMPEECEAPAKKARTANASMLPVRLKAVKSNRSVESWQEKRESELQKALKKWYALLCSWPVSLPQVKEFQEAKGLKMELLQDFLGDKAPATLLKRANSTLALESTACAMGFAFPYSEPELYQCLAAERRGGSKPSKIRGMLEAITFCRFTFGFDTLDSCVRSKRCRGVGRRDPTEVLQQAPPLKVCELERLHEILQKGEDPWDQLMCASALFCCYACARWSNFQHGDTFNPDFDDQGELAFVEMKAKIHKTMRAQANRFKFLDMVAPSTGVTQDNWGRAWMRAWAQIHESTIASEFPPMPAPDSDGLPTVRALDSDEAATWVAELLSLEGERCVTSHSFKATLLSYAAKRGLAHQDRLVMGHHVQEAKMADQYSRDAAARPLRLVQNLLREIRLKRFFPDASRAGRVVKAVREEANFFVEDSVLLF